NNNNNNVLRHLRTHPSQWRRRLLLRSGKALVLDAPPPAPLPPLPSNSAWTAPYFCSLLLTTASSRPPCPGSASRRFLPSTSTAYTFDGLSMTVEAFVDALGLTKFTPYVFDYSVPTSLRIALRHPDHVTAIITQNGNACDEGL
ncbi:hypothetical protein OF83DRAFT_1210576, partial [Amylostereum chailletii]